VYIALYQSHLDTLADAGVIDYNKPRGVVEPRPLLEYVASYTDWRGGDGEDSDDSDDSDEEGGDAWGRRFLGASVAGGLLLVGSAVNVAVFGTISSFAVSMIILTMFSVLTFAKLTLDGDGANQTEAD
jgi:hypothetical protein